MGTAGPVQIKDVDGDIATVTSDGFLDVKTHSSDRCFAGDYGDAQTGTAIITPLAGKRIKVIQVYVSTESITADVALVFNGAAAEFFKLYTAKTQTHTGALVCALGGVDKSVELTCGAKTFINIAYDEVD